MKNSGDYADNILASLPEGLLAADQELCIRAFNPALEEMIGISSSRAVGKRVGEVFCGTPSLESLMVDVLSSGQGRSLPEYPLTARGGQELLVGLMISTVIDGEGQEQGAVALVRDVGCLKALEENFRQTERLTYLETVSAGVAHEIKNPLAGIRGAAQLLTGELGKTPWREYTEVIVREVDRLNLIVERFLDLTRPRRLLFEPVNVHELLDRVILLEKETPAGQRTTFLRNYDPSLPEIIADGDQLTQVFLNLVRNALEAMPEGGEIGVVTKIPSADQLAKEREGGKYTRFIVASIEDEGIGIPQGKEGDLFIPFFTTKENGSGLGLAISYQIIKEHGGRIRIERLKRKGGTTVSVYLPIGP